MQGSPRHGRKTDMQLFPTSSYLPQQKLRSKLLPKPTVKCAYIGSIPEAVLQNGESGAAVLKFWLLPSDLQASSMPRDLAQLAKAQRS
eukprot:4843376-Amphidinium_carterae.2